MSEQILDEVEQRRQAREEAVSSLQTAAPASPAGRTLLRTAGLTGSVAAGLALLSMLLPPVGLLLWLWVVGAPVAALGVYAARHRESAPGAGFGARLGFLSGLAVLLALTIVNTLSLLLTRFAFHNAAPLDAQLGAVFAQVRAATEAQYGAAAAAPLAPLLSVPEFRAGFLLSSMAMFTVGYLLLATLGGAFAGVLRRQTAQS